MTTAYTGISPVHGLLPVLPPPTDPSIKPYDPCLPEPPLPASLRSEDRVEKAITQLQNRYDQLNEDHLYFDKEISRHNYRIVALEKQVALLATNVWSPITGVVVGLIGGIVGAMGVLFFINT